MLLKRKERQTKCKGKINCNKYVRKWETQTPTT